MKYTLSAEVLGSKTLVPAVSSSCLASPVAAPKRRSKRLGSAASTRVLFCGASTVIVLWLLREKGLFPVRKTQPLRGQRRNCSTPYDVFWHESISVNCNPRCRNGLRQSEENYLFGGILKRPNLLPTRSG